MTSLRGRRSVEAVPPKAPSVYFQPTPAGVEIVATNTMIPQKVTVHEHAALIASDPTTAAPLHLRSNKNVKVVVDDRAKHGTKAAIVSDLSTLECESVQADPNWTPTQNEASFVPPMEISIALWSKPEKEKPSVSRPDTTATAATEQHQSCHSRMMGQPIEDTDAASHVSYCTSPTDLYLSDESEIPIVISSPIKKGVMRREFKKMLGRVDALRRSNKLPKQQRQRQRQQQQQHGGEDYDSFASSRGCLI